MATTNTTAAASFDPLCFRAFGSCLGVHQAVRFIYVSSGFRGRSVAMSTTLKIRDETTFNLGDENDSGFLLDVPDERITVRELIRTRVYQEVYQYNLDRPEYFHGLIEPSDAERSLNGFKMRRRRKIDPERQFEMAIKAFYTNGFIVLLDDRQVDELEEEIEIRPDTTVTFLKLLPLVGG